MDDDRLTAFTRELIRTRSLTGEETAVVEKITAEMRALGFDRVFVDENGSAVGVVEGELPGPTLLLDGHCDTVGVTPADWQHDPFGAELDGGRIYGRGAADMKGALAAMIHAAASADRARMAGRVAVSATVMEEVLEGRALQTVMEEICPDTVVIGEATGFRLNHGGRGRAEVLLESSGRSAHSSSPQAGLCAVHEMIRVILALDAMPVPAHPLVGQGLMVLTDILSDPYPGRSVLPNRCRATYDRRLLPGETAQGVLDEIRARPELEGVRFTAQITAAAEKTPTGLTLEMDKFLPAWLLDAGHPFVQAALRGLRAAGFDPALGAYQFCTNAAYSAGVAGVPTVGFGPCQETDAHTADEFIAVEDLRLAARGYLGIIQSVVYA